MSFSLLVHNGKQSSRQGEFHPKPLTEPCLIVSHHTALLIYAVNISSSFEKLAENSNKLADPFAPFPLQKLHHYYESVRPCMPPRYFASGLFPLCISLCIAMQVPEFHN